jgi:hypothetical protein
MRRNILLGEIIILYGRINIHKKGINVDIIE